MEKKNALLLTVIAVATLLVAVVGATFAYFTATSTGTKEQTVEVTTDTINEAEFTPGLAISINANLNNFGKIGEEYTGDPATQTGTNEAHAKFKAGTAGTASMCYNVGLQIDKNTFRTQSAGYTLENIPELSMTVKKGSTTVYENLSLLGQGPEESTEPSVTIYFPEESSSVALTSPVQHKMTSTGEDNLIDDLWTTTISFNYDPNGSQNDNAGSMLSGKIIFTKLDKCNP